VSGRGDGDKDDRDEGFLMRWSRRKREVIADEEVTAPPPVAVAPQPVETAAGEPEPEMVEPPSLDLVDKDFDVAHWLRQNVPESWKLAALRRAWESDPAIAGYENPARDYALDWNTPGGAPGYGPLSESDDVEAMVRNIFGDPPAEPAGIEPVSGEGDSMSHQLSSHDERLAQHAALQNERDDAANQDGAKPVRTSHGSAENPEKTVAVAKVASAALQDSADPEPPVPRRRRRGGGATPL
jgi:hypothetical protein